MPHGFFGLGWGEVVSIVTLGTVIATYFKTSISRTAHESSRKDLEDLNSKLTDFKINISELSQLLKQLNRDLDGLTKRVDDHDKDIDNLEIEVAKIKEHLEEKK
ncbi:hypothetical protein LR3_06525 [Limosilactobacillus reuteri]|uniref:Uncharacterized protein n=1 Tax=Limosilactobacillus reuteri TaxID=1598 RepID=A0A073JPS1_LIMRT|nr:hypothetical protein LR3_06525 [Limosilactobacillus reuteri]